MVLVPTTPATLAVLIGIIELVIIEFFRATLNAAQGARRRLTLYREGRLHLPLAAARKTRLDARISLASFIIIVVIIRLELTIDGLALRRTSVRAQSHCHAPDRSTRYFGGFGPFASEVEDPRFPDYLEQTQCEDTLLASALSSAEALEIGYPHCAPPFGSVSPRFVEAELQGCVVGFVAGSKEGDMHCDVLPVGINNETSLAGNSFLAVLESGQNSTSYFQFTSPDQRLLTNTRIPGSWMVNETANSVDVPCRNLDIECYLLSKTRAATAPKTVQESEAPAGIYIQVLQNGNSTVCLFENGMRSRAEWLVMDQLLPGAEERDRRKGPVLTGFSVQGDARCIDQLDVAVARMHYDGVEFATLPPEKGLVVWLQRYVVAIGIRTSAASEIPCEIFKAVEGSSIDRGWLIAASVLSGLAVLLSLLAVMYALYVLFTCPTKTDPLTLNWSIAQLIQARPELQDTRPVGSLNKGGDMYIGVTEDEFEARFAVYPDANFSTVRRSTLPFNL